MANSLIGCICYPSYVLKWVKDIFYCSGNSGNAKEQLNTNVNGNIKAEIACLIKYDDKFFGGLITVYLSR